MDPFPIWMQDVPEVGIPFTEVEGRLIASRKCHKLCVTSFASC